MLGASDLPIRSPQLDTNNNLDPFDYASARLDLNDVRERKLRADALLKKYVNSTSTKNANSTSTTTTTTTTSTTTTSRDAMAREIDRRIAMVARTLDSRRGKTGRRLGSKKTTSSKTSSASNSYRRNQPRNSPNAKTPGRSSSARSFTTAASNSRFRRTPRAVMEVGEHPSPQRRERTAPRNASPVGQLLHKASRRSSVRPAELVGIRTVPKPEIPVVRQVPRRKTWKQATPKVVDKRPVKQNKQHNRPPVHRPVDQDPRPGSTTRSLVLLAAASPPKVADAPAVVASDQGRVDSQAQENWVRGTKETGSVLNDTMDMLHTLETSETKREQYEMQQMAEEETEGSGDRPGIAPSQPVARVTASRRAASGGGGGGSGNGGNSNGGNGSSNVGAITREISAALREHYHDSERRLVDVEQRERETAEAYRRALLSYDHERELSAVKEEELNRAHSHMSEMLSAVEALREANTSLEVTNSALVEQVDKVHQRASVAEQESLRQWRTQLKKEEIALGLSNDAAADLAENLPYEQMILDVVTSLIVENVYDGTTGGLLSDMEMAKRGLLRGGVGRGEGGVNEKRKPMGRNGEEKARGMTPMVQDGVEKVEKVEKVGVEKVGGVEEEEEEEEEDGEYEDEFETEEVEEETPPPPRTPKGKIIDPPRSTAAEVEEVEEDLFSDEETYADELQNRSRHNNNNNNNGRGTATITTTEMYTSSSSTSPQYNNNAANNHLLTQLMEEKNKRTLVEKELGHRQETQVLQQQVQLYELQLKQQQQDHERNEQLKAIQHEKILLENQLQNALHQNNRMEMKIEELTNSSVTVPTIGSSTGSNTGSSLGALLRAKTEAVEEEEDEDEEDDVVEGTITNEVIVPSETKQQHPSGVPLILFQTQPHLQPIAADTKRQYDDLLSDYST